MSLIQTQSGKYIDLLSPQPEQFEIEDIAHSLAHQCRFNGHSRLFYSVAEHSVFVAGLVSEEHRLAALLHDAAEAITGDIVYPLKQAINDISGGLIDIIERDIHAAIAERFGIAPTLPDEVKHADRMMLATERQQLLPEQLMQWDILNGIDPADLTLPCWVPHEAKREFTRLFKVLT